MTATVLNLAPLLALTREQFYRLCAANPEAKLERTAKGELIVMAPTGGETSFWNAGITTELALWNRQYGLGVVFDSSGGFALPNGADRSPDAAWIPLAKWNALTAEQRRGFVPLCPDFVVELLSPTDSWPQGQRKLEEYIANGCCLGWLIDPQGKRVAIYRRDRPVEILEIAAAAVVLSGEEVLPGFTLELAALGIA